MVHIKKKKKSIKRKHEELGRSVRQYTSLKNREKSRTPMTDPVENEKWAVRDPRNVNRVSKMKQ